MKQAVWLAAALMMLLPLGKVYSKERSERENNTLRIRNGRGTDDVTDFRRTAAVINKVCPDVVAVQEIDSVTGRSGGKDVLREIAGLTLMHHMYAPAIDYDGGKYGIGMLSKEKPLGYLLLYAPFADRGRPDAFLAGHQAGGGFGKQAFLYSRRYECASRFGVYPATAERFCDPDGYEDADFPG